MAPGLGGGRLRVQPRIEGFLGFARILQGSKTRLSRPKVWALVGLTALTVAVVIGGFVVGADKGSLRIVASVGQVSTPGLNSGIWTAVTPHQYQVWDAGFIREEAALSIFALIMIGISVWFVGLHRRGLKQG